MIVFLEREDCHRCLIQPSNEALFVLPTTINCHCRDLPCISLSQVPASQPWRKRMVGKVQCTHPRSRRLVYLLFRKFNRRVINQDHSEISNRILDLYDSTPKEYNREKEGEIVLQKTVDETYGQKLKKELNQQASPEVKLEHPTSGWAHFRPEKILHPNSPCRSS